MAWRQWPERVALRIGDGAPSLLYFSTATDDGSFGEPKDLGSPLKSGTGLYCLLHPLENHLSLLWTVSSSPSPQMARAFFQPQQGSRLGKGLAFAGKSPFRLANPLRFRTSSFPSLQGAIALKGLHNLGRLLFLGDFRIHPTPPRKVQRLPSGLQAFLSGLQS